ncbi:transposase [Mariniflexile litorale]|uniref:Transposase n=1 Tax=Mariniflexile litorale TaxID=3045158 RepID=A0AAU7ELF6_9FLAO
MIPFKKIFYEGVNNNKKKEYRASKKVCIDCPLRSACLKKSQEKRITITYYVEEYERNNLRVNSARGRYMKGKRQSTVEPVFGTLTQFLGLRKINTIGIKQANKVMHMAAMAYNLKKYLKFTQKRVKSGAGMLALLFCLKKRVYELEKLFLRNFKIANYKVT